MEEHIVSIESITKVTHDVLRIVTSKPAGYEYTPGQATEISINKKDWTEEKRPFTFTSLPSENHLEFTIKTYPERGSVTNELLKLKKDDELILHEVFGAIAYKRPGVFIAGGAGITPFICIFRQLLTSKEIGKNMLIFANKTKADIINEKEFSEMLGPSFINILSDENQDGYFHGRINETFLQLVISDFNQQFYVCGPPPMMDAVLQILSNLNVSNNTITIEI